MKLKPKDIPELSYINTLIYGIDLYAIDETYSVVKYNGISMPMCKGQLAIRNYLN